MKKVVLALLVFLVTGIGTGFAAPLNDLAQGGTAIGIGIHGGDPSSNDFYLEHKLSSNFLLGFQSIDWDHSGNFNDVYGQFQLGSNVRAIVGNRDFDSGSKMYIGAGVTGPMGPGTSGYAYMIGGNTFKELQLGANFRVASNLDLNLSYRSFMPDQGDNVNGIGAGLSLKF